jgi:hypothetical protein
LGISNWAVIYNIPTSTPHHHPHKLMAGVHDIVCHGAMWKLATFALLPSLLIDAFPIVILDPPRHLVILRRKPQITFCESKKLKWIKRISKKTNLRKMNHEHSILCRHRDPF